MQLRFDAGEDRRTTRVGDPSGASLVPDPPSPDWEIGEFAFKALDHDPPVGSSSLLTHHQFAMRRARGAEDVDASRQQRRIVANHDEDAIEDCTDRVCSGPRGAEAWVRPWMPEINDDGVTGKSVECRRNRTKTIADLQAIGAAQPRDHSQSRPVWHGD